MNKNSFKMAFIITGMLLVSMPTLILAALQIEQPINFGTLPNLSRQAIKPQIINHTLCNTVDQFLSLEDYSLQIAVNSDHAIDGQFYLKNHSSKIAYTINFIDYKSNKETISPNKFYGTVWRCGRPRTATLQFVIPVSSLRPLPKAGTYTDTLTIVSKPG